MSKYIDVQKPKITTIDSFNRTNYNSDKFKKVSSTYPASLYNPSEVISSYNIVHKCIFVFH